MITQQELKELLHYNPETGIFTRKTKVNRNKVIGSIAGTTDFHGYVAIAIDGKKYKAHRLAWLYMYGKFPDNCIDHINNITTDNRIVNLRDATLSQNQCNKKINVNNSSGVRVFDSAPNKLKVPYVSYITLPNVTSQVTVSSPGFRPWIGISMLTSTGGAGELPGGLTNLMGVCAQQNNNDSVTFLQQSVARIPVVYNGAYWGNYARSVIFGE